MAPRGPFDLLSAARWPTMHFNARELDEVIGLHGVCCELRRSVACPCTRVETRLASASCEVCHGIGLAYPEDLRERCRFLVSGRSARPVRQPAGQLVDGSVAVTFPSAVIPGAYDVFLPDGEVSTVHEVFHRDLQQVQRSTLAARLLVPDQTSRTHRARPTRLLHETPTDLAVYWIHEGRLVRATEAVDYKLTGNLLEWLPGASPAAGDGFSVRYLAPAAYMVQGSEPVVRIENGAAMPWRVQAQRLDKVQRTADVRP